MYHKLPNGRYKSPHFSIQPTVTTTKKRNSSYKVTQVVLYLYLCIYKQGKIKQKL